MTDLLDLLDKEERVEEVVEFNVKYTPQMHVASIIHNPTIRMENAVHDLFGVTGGQLEKALLIESSRQFINVDRSYEDLELPFLVKRLAIDLYCDFAMNIDSESVEDEEVTPCWSMTPAQQLIGVREDIELVIGDIMPLFKGVEDAIKYCQNSNDLKFLAASNMVLNSYVDDKITNQVREGINNGEGTPIQMFVYTLIKYNHALLENLK